MVGQIMPAWPLCFRGSSASLLVPASDSPRVNSASLDRPLNWPASARYSIKFLPISAKFFASPTPPRRHIFQEPAQVRIRLVSSARALQSDRLADHHRWCGESQQTACSVDRVEEELVAPKAPLGPHMRVKTRKLILGLLVCLKFY